MSEGSASPVRARRRCASCGAAARSRDRFCSECGTPLAEAVTVAPGASGASLQISGHQLSKLSEQRKVVTILFADLSGSTALGEHLDPEELRGVLASYFAALSKQIARYEGTIDKYIGDAIMAVFGAPLSHEDDAERAINAALAMQASMARLNEDLSRRHGVRLALRVGINTGEVVAGLLAGDVQSAYTVVGDAVNTAQRFESAAPLGEILVSATTRRLALRSFEFEATAPLALKGKAERVVAYRVLRRRYDEIAPESAPFVGRERELDLLRAAVGDAVAGGGGIVNVVGDAGVGKSRVVGELRAGLATGIDRITVRCASFEANTPYAMVADFVRGAFSIHAADDEPTARQAIANGFAALGRHLDEGTLALLLDLLGYADSSSLDPEVKRRVIVALLRDLLRLGAARAPFVLVAEDMHWVDGASLRVLEELVPIIPTLSALFITTSRPGWTPSWPTRAVELRPLEDAEASALIEAVFEVPVDGELSGAIIARTGGNPFFIEEVVRELMSTNLLVERTGRVALRPDAKLSVPATVQEVVEARLDRLPDGTRRVLGLAAVCGRTFWYRVVDRLAGDGGLSERLGELEREGFVALRSVSPELTYAFRQILIQEVAYQTQLQSERRRTHAAIGAVMEDLYADRLEEFVDFLAYHYERSDDPPRACRFLLLAGARAQRLYANEEALRYFESAHRLAVDDATRAAALEGLGDVRTTIGALPGARDAYAGAHGLVAEPAAQARLERKTGGTFQRTGDYQMALQWLERARARLGDSPTAENAAVWVDVAHVVWRQGRYDEAIAAGERGVALSRFAEVPQMLAEGYKHLGTTHVLKGDHDRGLDLYRRALEIYEALADLQGQMNVHNNLGIVLRRQSRWEEALAEQGRALDLARRIGDAWGVGMVLANTAETLRNRGDFDGALKASQEALATWSQVGNAVGVATVHMNVGILSFEHGRLAEAREALHRSRAEWEKLDSKLFLPELYRTLAKVELTGDARGALGWARRSLEVAREIKAKDEEGIALQVLGMVHAALGEHEAAVTELRESVTILRSARNRLELARSLSALAQALEQGGRERGEVVRLAREAAEIFAELGSPDERARAQDIAARA